MYMTWEDVKNIANPKVREELIRFYCYGHEEEFGKQYIHYKEMCNGKMSWSPQEITVTAEPIPKYKLSKETVDYLDSYFNKRQRVKEELMSGLSGLLD